jgi:hypothetical protein
VKPWFVLFSCLAALSVNRTHVSLVSVRPNTTVVVTLSAEQHFVASAEANRHRTHTAIAKAVIDLGKTGQLDPAQLKRYAVAQARSALSIGR